MRTEEEIRDLLDKIEFLESATTDCNGVFAYSSALIKWVLND